MARRSTQGRPSGTPTPEKTCVSCGRRMQWRTKWASSWDEVKYCSDACRRRGISPGDIRLENAILELLAARPAGQTVDLAEAAPLLGDDETPEPVEPARRAARRLVARGLVDIIQNGRVVDPSTARGPLQIRRRA